MTLRSALQRKTDTLKRLEQDRDVWVATAHEGQPHLVPFSLDWDGARVVATSTVDSLTARNLAAGGRARLALGTTRDVVVMDVTVEIVYVAEAPAELSEHFLARNGWDPRTTQSPYVYFLMTPVQIQAWNSEEELKGRTVMKDGRWLA